MIFYSLAGFMAEAMIWQMFRTVLGLRPLGCRLLSTLPGLQPACPSLLQQLLVELLQFQRSEFF